MHPNALGGRAPHGPAGGAYSAPKAPSWIKGEKGEWERGRGGRWEWEKIGRERRKGEDPQCMKCVDVNAAEYDSERILKIG